MAVGLPGQAGAYATLVGECMATFRPSYLPRESAHGLLSLQGGLIGGFEQRCCGCGVYMGSSQSGTCESAPLSRIISGLGERLA